MHPDHARGLLTQLTGSWSGVGELEYPTIESTAYRERLEVRDLDAAWPLHYLQQTWKVASDAQAPSHVEAGFITVTPEGRVEVLNAQGPDRVEVLAGTIEAFGETSWRLELEAKLHGHDVRMRNAVRTLELDGDALRYSVSMATDRVPDMTLHLSATLERDR